MGNALATNIANETVNQSINSMNMITDLCTEMVTLGNGINIEAKDGGTITIEDLQCDQSTYYMLNANCVANATINSSINSNISQQASQVAKALSQNIDLNPGSTDATNVVNAITNAMDTLQSSVYNSCLQSAIAKNTVNITATGVNPNTGDPSTVTLGYFHCNQDIMNSTVADCVFNSSETAAVVSSISQAISQSATATVQNALGWIIMAIAIIFLVFFFITISGLELLLYIFIFVMIILIIYGVIAYIYNWWPFNHKANTPGSGLVTTNVSLTSTTPVKQSFTPLIAGDYQLSLTADPTSNPGSFSISITGKSSSSVYTAPNVTFFPTPGSTTAIANPLLLTAPFSLSADTYTLTLTSSTNATIIFSTIAVQPSLPSTTVPGQLEASPALLPSNPLLINVNSSGGSYKLSFGDSITIQPGTIVYAVFNPVALTSWSSAASFPFTAGTTNTNLTKTPLKSPVTSATSLSVPQGTTVLGLYVPVGGITADTLSLA